MNDLWRDFTNNPADWLTFLSTSILGVATAYFAWRSRQLERKQTRHINREFDRELVEAETEIEKGRTIIYLWLDNWKSASDSLHAFEIYALSRGNIVRPDLPTINRVLAFHIPEIEQRTSSAIIRLYATLDFLDLVLKQRPQLSDREISAQVARAEDAFAAVKEELDSSLHTVTTLRSKLRREA